MKTGEGGHGTIAGDQAGCSISLTTGIAIKPPRLHGSS
jgi:hypothetical protein